MPAFPSLPSRAWHGGVRALARAGAVSFPAPPHRRRFRRGDARPSLIASLCLLFHAFGMYHP